MPFPGSLDFRFPAILLLGLTAVASTQAQWLVPETIDWKIVRDAQPAGLELRLELPKRKFHAGEVINAKLTFANTTPSPHFMWIGTFDRTGRIRDIAFRGTDQNGQPIKDPLRWYLDRQFFGGGGGHFKEIGQWEFTLPVNQWLRFDRPGTYQIFAYSDRVKPGGLLARYQPDLKGIPLVSEKVEVEIVPLSAEQEAEIITRATQDLAGDRETAARAATVLRYLGTPRSREALLTLLGSPDGIVTVTSLAFAASPSPEAEAQVILDAVSSGKLKLNYHLAQLYAALKTSAIPAAELVTLITRSNPDPAQEFVTQITEAAANTSGRQGADYYQSLLVSLQLAPRGQSPARDGLVKAQLDLTPRQMEAILDGWGAWGGEDFLPLLRKSVGPPIFSYAALQILSTQWPDEARPLVIEDIQREHSRYLRPDAVPKMANEPLLALPPGAIPELEEFFRKKLAAAKTEKDLNLILPAIDRYGAPALLPDVIKVYQPNEGKWACELQNSALRFWIRVDRPAGLAALASALDSREDTGCYHTALNEVLRHHWQDDAIPLVTFRLSDPDPQVVESAIQVLKRQAGMDWIEPSVQAAERLSAKSDGENEPFYASRRIAQLLLDPQSRWPLSPAQTGRLETILAKQPR